MPTYSDGDTIRRLREEQGLNLTQFAERVGKDRGYVSRIENGLANGSPATRLAMARVLNVPLTRITFQAPRNTVSKVAA
ncbi:putative DNA-binding protein [Actinoplanes missouriensis 431]|uniref:Putative DNA-binding protein n=1 Tax=Actinoplanes missouriensis (strain ATCC 14538 / DSM 43046 / CBS 188.64 / JCM 3121 / NBRC 102363 / NCIMB 12654 / NRRL B-3342 / UNCC 431) TaxID=512565 RepID=I0H2Y9_ACTM4|nr:helix-turn-helix transcriptional regulator [Actinoplanes missouriensis]BAL87376.1 putative DNA-binding protein [Actinoplanes missouriensis 431]